MDEMPNPKVILPVVVTTVILVAGVFFAFQWSRGQKSTIVLPGGITYLGPSPTPQPPTRSPQTVGDWIPISPDTVWAEYQGTRYPYTFQYPSTLSLGVFPNDPYDSVTVFYGGSDPQNNLFFRVDDLALLNKSSFIGKPKDYAQNWWKDYSAWKGIATVTEFTNNEGLKGYRAKYVNDKDQTPYDHVFFTVPGKPNLVIWISGKLFTAEVFDRLVNSVSWH